MRVPSDSIVLALLCLPTCAGPAESPPAFGGRGAQVGDPNEIPLQEGQGELATGPCARPAPVADNPMLEDFEDGDHHLFKVFERDGWWFTATDDTQGVVEPPRDGFKPTLLSDAEATTENRYAAHLSASGFTDWGVVWGASLEWKREGVSCPFNGSAFDGLRLRARGKGRVRVNFGTPATFPKDNRGACTKGCYDTHGRILDLTETWTEYTIAFGKLQQGGWGTEARFDTEHLLALNFSSNPEWQPVDLWLDDLAWIPRGGAAAAPLPSVAVSSAPAASASTLPPAPAASAAPSASALPGKEPARSK